MFKNAGDANIGKVERYGPDNETVQLLTQFRKLVQCHLDVSNVAAARDVWEKMSAARKQYQLSRYLQYCIALRSRDDTAGRFTDSEPTY